MSNAVNKADLWEKKARAVAIEEAVDLLLPSGMTIRALRPGPGFLAAHGHLPLSLATHAIALGGEDITERGRKAEASHESTLTFAAFLRDLLETCVVEPRISLTPGPGEIRPSRIPDCDLHYIFHWAMRGSEAEGLETFRRKRNDAPARDDSTQVPPAPINAAGHHGPAAGSEF